MLRIIASVTAIVLIAAVSASSQAPEKPRQDFLSAMKVDQAVTVKEMNGRYDITMIENGLAQMSHKIVEVGSDYVVVADLAGVIETRIPVYSIKKSVRLKILNK